MATRFYLPGSGTPPSITASWGNAWEAVGARVIRPTFTTKTSTAHATASATSADTIIHDVLVGQFISEPLAAQSIAGNWTATVKCSEANTGHDASLQLLVRVVSGDGSTTRGEVYAGHTAANTATVGALGEEMSVAGAESTRIIPSTAGSSVSAQAGDRLVIELGYRSAATDNVGRAGVLDFGDNQGSDYALTSGLTTSIDPWVETSETLTFAPPTPVAYVSQGAAVEGTTSITTAAYGTGWAAGDLAVCVVASNHTTEATEPTVSGFTNRGTLNGGGGSQGAGTGNRRLTYFTRECVGGDDDTPAVSLSTGNVMIAAITILRKPSGYAWVTPVAAFGAETTAGTSWSEVMTSDPGFAATDMMVAACAIRDTSTTSAEGFTATGATFSALDERIDLASETGNDISLHVSTSTVLTGPSSAAGTRTATHSTSESGVMGVLRVRAIASTKTGVATASLGFTGTAAGVPRTFGVAAASFGGTFTAAGVPRTFGMAAASFGFTATALGKPRTFGQAVATFGYTGTAAGVDRALGQAVAAFGFTATASGVDRALGAAAASFGFTATTLGKPRTFGQAVASFGYTGTASGVPEAFGVALASFGFTATASGAALSRNQVAVLADTPLAFYRLGEPSGTTMADSSGNARDGTYVAGPTLGVTSLLALDTANTAVTFDGSTEYGTVAWASWQNSASITVEAWVKTTHSGQNQQILTRDGGNPANTRAFQVRISATGLLEFVRITDAAGTLAAVTVTSLGAAVNDGVAHHVAATYDGSTVNLYVDGELRISSALSAGLNQPASTVALAVGARTLTGGAPADPFNGTLDEVAYYGTVLSAARIAIHAAAGGAVKGVAAASFGFTGAASGVPRVSGAAAASLGFTATAAGVARRAGQGLAAFGFTATAAGIDRAIGAALASLGFTATASGTPTVIGSAGASFGFTATASGAPRTQGTAAAAFGFTGTASGMPRVVGAAAVSFGFTGSASGIDRALGQALAALGFTATSAGVVRHRGVAAASFGFTATASGAVGTPPVQGSATASFGFTGTAAGVPAKQGSAVGSFGFTASVSGVPNVLGLATAALGFTATAAGVPKTQGTASATFGFTGTAAGIDRALGVAAASFGFTGAASSQVLVYGVATASFGFSGTASGAVGTPPVTGAAVASFGFTAAASGQPRTQGTASGAFGFTGEAAGIDRALGTAVASLGFTGAASGTPRVFGVAVALYGFTGTAQGFPETPPVTGTGTASFGFTGSATGQPSTLSVAVGVFGFTASANGIRTTYGVAAAVFTFTATASGSVPPTADQWPQSLGTHRETTGLGDRHRELVTIGGHKEPNT